MSEPEPKFRFRVRCRTTFAERVRTGSNAELDAEACACLTAQNRSKSDHATCLFGRAPTTAQQSTTSTTTPFSDVLRKLTAFFAMPPNWFNDRDDELPTSGPAASSSRLHPFFTGTAKPVGKIAGARRRSAHTTRPSAHMIDPNNTESSVCAGVRTRSERRTEPFEPEPAVQVRGSANV
ncbi:hypothetical protein C8R45DRAFT_1083900 [Mycena sanguinolenta]|nr:hypothetical protein C8R45DRAFT_1084682 [Mycena sanguinolenta]KAJ6450669.1 hypothetical protein C8R45DRAFT_1083900 [Mycena sanguinolenta]